MQLSGGALYGSFAAVTPSDTTPINCRALLVVTAGQLTVAARPGGTAVDFKTTMPAGTIIPIMLDGGTVNAATAAVALVTSCSARKSPTLVASAQFVEAENELAPEITPLNPVVTPF